jgi:hypothetical protein
MPLFEFFLAGEIKAFAKREAIRKVLTSLYIAAPSRSESDAPVQTVGAIVLGVE